jgi:sulfite exporter TauE/SafE
VTAAVVKAVLLGLSTGLMCMGYCAPALVPLLMGSERSNGMERWRPLLWFLFGRFIAYITCGVLAGLIGQYLFRNINARITAWLYLAIAVLLLVYSFRRKRSDSSLCHRLYQQRSGRNAYFILGLLLGFNLCPPFIAAFSDVLAVGEVGYGVIFFLCFFMVTSLFFLPLGFLGFLGAQKEFRSIGRMAAALSGGLYGFLGLMILIT